MNVGTCVAHVPLRLRLRLRLPLILLLSLLLLFRCLTLPLHAVPSLPLLLL